MLGIIVFLLTPYELKRLAIDIEPFLDPEIDSQLSEVSTNNNKHRHCEPCNDGGELLRSLELTRAASTQAKKAGRENLKVLPYPPYLRSLPVKGV